MWDLGKLYSVSALLGAVACASSVLLLWLALDSGNAHGAWAALGLAPLQLAEIRTIMYLKARHVPRCTAAQQRNSTTAQQHNSTTAQRPAQHSTEPAQLSTRATPNIISPTGPSGGGARRACRCR